jgi:Tfp pilus assembly protein PilO
MTGRDRMVLIVIVVVAVIGAAWMLLVSPERKQASQLSAQVSEAQSQLTSAEGKVSSARAAQSQYAAAYTSVVSLGKAVPPSQEVPALIDQLTQASNQKKVDFSSITSSSPATGAATAAFTELPFSFVFEGSYFNLEHLFSQLTDFAKLNSSGQLEVNGRLLTIEAVKLAPATSTTEASKNGAKLTGTITASAYVLPASQGLTGTASATGTGATPASSTAPASSATSPALVRVNP